MTPPTSKPNSLFHRCTCGHLVGSHKVTKAPKTIKDMPKIKCLVCKCRKIELQ